MRYHVKLLHEDWIVAESPEQAAAVMAVILQDYSFYNLLYRVIDEGGQIHDVDMELFEREEDIERLADKAAQYAEKQRSAERRKKKADGNF